MATDPKAALRSQRAYTKRKHIAQAELAGAQILDITIAARAHDGHFVIRLYDGDDLHLDLRAELPPVKPEKAAKFYAPKSWDPAKWNGVVATMRDKTFTKEDAHKGIDQGVSIDDKQKRQAKAVVDAMPDAPDWYAYLPLADL